MIEWSIVLDRVLYGFPAAAAILLVISVLRAFWRLTRRVAWWMANGPEISRSSFEVYRDKVRTEPPFASPGEFEMGDSSTNAEGFAATLEALGRRVAALEKKMGQQTPGRGASRPTPKSSTVDANTVVPLERPTSTRRKIDFA
jgi:hypothetical protein